MKNGAEKSRESGVTSHEPGVCYLYIEFAPNI